MSGHIRIKLGEVPEYEGLTLHQIAVWELLEFKRNGKPTCWGKQSKMAQEIHVSVNTFYNACMVLKKKGKLKDVERRRYDLLFVFPDSQNSDSQNCDSGISDDKTSTSPDSQNSESQNPESQNCDPDSQNCDSASSKVVPETEKKQDSTTSRSKTPVLDPQIPEKKPEADPEKKQKPKQKKPPYQPTPAAQACLKTWTDITPLPVTTTELACLETLDKILRIKNVSVDRLQAICRFIAQEWVRDKGFALSPGSLRQKKGGKGDMERWEKAEIQMRKSGNGLPAADDFSDAQRADGIDPYDAKAQYRQKRERM